MIQIGHLQRVKNYSIFYKLLAVIVFSALTVNIVVGISFYSLVFSPVKEVNHFVFKCANYVLGDLEKSFDKNRIRDIEEDFGIVVRLEQGNNVLSSSDDIPPLKNMRLKSIKNQTNQFLGFYQGKAYLILMRDQGTYIVAPKFYVESERPGIWILVVLLILTFVFILSYQLLQKLLSPIRELKGGVTHIISGDFDYRLQVERDDELGKLSGAFNNMTTRLKQLLYSKEQLLLNVSHELRSPLTRIKLAMEFLPECSKRENIIKDIRLMETMVSDLLDSARSETEITHSDFQELDLVKLIKNVCEKLKYCKPGITSSFSSDVITVYWNKKRIELLLMNLLENALYYSTEFDNPVNLLVEKKQDDVIMIITDRGEGIPEKDLPHIFEPFFRVDKSRSKKTGGYGMGLALCKQTVDLHGGDIEVNSQLGQGTEIKVVLPANMLLSTSVS